MLYILALQRQSRAVAVLHGWPLPSITILGRTASVVATYEAWDAHFHSPLLDRTRGTGLHNHRSRQHGAH